MSSALAVVVTFLLQGAQPPAPAVVLREPAYAPDGRLAVSIDGDLWVQQRAGRDGGWRRLTSGPSWDRQPAWSADGQSLVFTSDRGGNTDLWRLRVAATGAAGQPERLTSDSAPDLEPSVGPDGVIAGRANGRAG